MSYAGPVKPSGRARPAVRKPPATRTDAETQTALIAGLAIGAVIGAGVALLLAPRSGRSTRRRLARGAHRLGDSIGDRGRDAWSDLRSEFRHILDKRRQHRLEDRQRRSLSLRDASSL